MPANGGQETDAASILFEVRNQVAAIGSNGGFATVMGFHAQ